NKSAAPERLVDIAIALDGKKDEPVATIVKRLNKFAGIPDKLSAAGVKAEQIPAMVEQAFEDASHLLNPRSVIKDDLKKLYEKAL
ncbi:iron-containing alcohol dehydrogenase, partial [Cytophagia bacterium CHB2]|nr:iron-containing alcohol dehydrogenase [Cytophagia bacterium CHB2]